MQKLDDAQVVSVVTALFQRATGKPDLTLDQISDMVAERNVDKASPSGVSAEQRAALKATQPSLLKSSDGVTLRTSIEFYITAKKAVTGSSSAPTTIESTRASLLKYMGPEISEAIKKMTGHTLPQEQVIEVLEAHLSGQT